jgi:hypothetical protein
MAASDSLDVSPALERAVSAHDASIESLSEDERRIVGRVWLHRAESEITAALAFSDLARDLLVEPAAPTVRWLAVRAAADEMRHSEICRRIANRYLDANEPLPEPRPCEPARFGDCPESLNRVLRVVLHTCMSEALGSAALKRLLDEATSPTVRAALHELLRDEIDHARIGYAHLASGLVSRAYKEQVRRAIPTLIELLRRVWLTEGSSAPPNTPVGHGGLTPGGVAEVLDDSISNLILPGLDQVL